MNKVLYLGAGCVQTCDTHCMDRAGCVCVCVKMCCICVSLAYSLASVVKVVSLGVYMRLVFGCVPGKVSVVGVFAIREKLLSLVPFVNI